MSQDRSMQPPRPSADSGHVAKERVVDSNYHRYREALALIESTTSDEAAREIATEAINQGTALERMASYGWPVAQERRSSLSVMWRDRDRYRAESARLADVLRDIDMIIEQALPHE